MPRLWYPPGSQHYWMTSMQRQCWGSTSQYLWCILSICCAGYATARDGRPPLRIATNNRRWPFKGGWQQQDTEGCVEAATLGRAPRLHSESWDQFRGKRIWDKMTTLRMAAMMPPSMGWWRKFSRKANCQGSLWSCCSQSSWRGRMPNPQRPTRPPSSSSVFFVQEVFRKVFRFTVL